MESTQVVNEAFLRNMLALRRSYRAGLLSRKEEPVANCFICCCETTNCGVPADASIFFVGDTGMKAIQRELTLHQFGP
jgi:hypothetical protein